MEVVDLVAKQKDITEFIDTLMSDIAHMHNEYILTDNLVDSYNDCECDNVVDVNMLNHIDNLIQSEFARYKRSLEVVQKDFAKLNSMVGDCISSWSTEIDDTNYGTYIFQMRRLSEDLEKIYNKAEDVHDEYKGFNNRVKGVLSRLNTDETDGEGE